MMVSVIRSAKASAIEIRYSLNLFNLFEALEVFTDSSSTSTLSIHKPPFHSSFCRRGLRPRYRWIKIGIWLFAARRQAYLRGNFAWFQLEFLSCFRNKSLSAI
jgi:hypothetical protein